MQGMWFRRPVVGSVVIVALGAAWFGSLGVGAQTSHEVTAALVDEWTRELSNWGRWGQDDQLGTVNLITPENRRRALESRARRHHRFTVAQLHYGGSRGRAVALWT